MSYLPSALLVLAGLVLLVLLVLRTSRELRRFARVGKLVSGHAANQTGLVKARTAALTLAIAQRRTPRTIGMEAQEDNHA